MTIGELIPPMSTTVLIVDDEEPIRLVVDRVLQSARYVTRLVPSGAAALAVATEGPDRIDLLITDMMMPEMNGDEVARRLRQKHPALKVLYFTGYSDRLFDDKGTMWEDEAFLEKPSGPRGLLEAVALLCSRSQCIGDLELTRVPGTEIPVRSV
jgi:two-component system cell cycle sensor histidine kinase/response regulator CckA